jgi:hypothetical protein
MRQAREYSPIEREQVPIGERKIFDFKLYIQDEFIDEALNPQYIERVRYLSYNHV